jgi:hypothetical protein
MGSRAALAKAIPQRPRVRGWPGLAFAIGFALLLLPVITAERWLGPPPALGEPSALTVRVPPLAGFDTPARHIGGGVVVARGATVTPDVLIQIQDLGDTMPGGPRLAVAVLLLVGVLAAIFSHHMRRSTYGRLVRVQLASLGAIAIVAVGVKALMLLTPVSILVVPVALFALVPTLCLDRIVGLATGVLAALVLAILAPFDLGVAILLLVQVAVAGLVVAERPKKRWSAAFVAGLASTVCTAATFPVLRYLTTGHLPSADLAAWHAPWLAAALGPAIATLLAVPLVPLYQRLVGEITQGRLVELEDLSNPLLVQIATRAPGTWQHSLAMANLAEIAANAIGANGRLVRVGAYYHDLGKSLQPKYFIENLEPGETSPHDQLPPEVSCEAIFKHVTEGLAAARRAGLHERIVDFMHMHHGNGVLEYFWARCREQGNPNKLTVEDFRYPGVPPHTRETAILAICDAVEAASRTLKKPDAAAIDSLVQRIVYGKLHLGQLDDSGLSMGDLRRVADSLRETIRHANHGRIEYPWQREAAAQAGASAIVTPRETPAAGAAAAAHDRLTQTGPRLDSLDRPARPDVVAPAPREAAISDSAPQRASGSNPPMPVTTPEALAATADLRGAETPTAPALRPATSTPPAAPTRDTVPDDEHDADSEADTADEPNAPAAAADGGAPDRPSREELAILETAPAMSRPTPAERRTGRQRAEIVPEHVAELQLQLPLPAKIPGESVPALPLPDELSARYSRSRRSPDAGDSLGALIEPPPPAARKRAATLPPMPLRRAPTAPPPNRTAGNDYDPETTNPRLRMPLPAPPASDPEIALPPAPSAAPSPAPAKKPSLAERIDAAIENFDGDSDAGPDPAFGGETPVAAPTPAQLRALIGSPDVTRRQHIDELERLHHEARAAAEAPAPRRSHPTAEVDDDDIEAAIDLAPPARRAALAVGIAKKKPAE